MSVLGVDSRGPWHDEVAQGGVDADQDQISPGSLQACNLRGFFWCFGFFGRAGRIGRVDPAATDGRQPTDEQQDQNAEGEGGFLEQRISNR